MCVVLGVPSLQLLRPCSFHAQAIGRSSVWRRYIMSHMCKITPTIAGKGTILSIQGLG